MSLKVTADRAGSRLVWASPLESNATPGGIDATVEPEPSVNAMPPAGVWVAVMPATLIGNTKVPLSDPVGRALTTIVSLTPVGWTRYRRSMPDTTSWYVAVAPSIDGAGRESAG